MNIYMVTEEDQEAYGAFECSGYCLECRHCYCQHVGKECDELLEGLNPYDVSVNWILENRDINPNRPMNVFTITELF